MKLRKRWAAAAVLPLIAAAVPILAQRAAAATPAWEPDPQSLGTVSFYDSTGTLITSGANLNHLFSYAEASTGSQPGGNPKASIKLGFPNHTQPTSAWFVQSVSASTLFPNASAPAPINGFTNPVASPGPTDVNLNANLNAGTLDTTAGYANIMQIRLYQSGITGNYWASDIMYDTGAGTWTQVYPAPAAGPTTTTTTVSTTEASPQNFGTTIHIKATVSPSSAVGNVQFKDGATNIGSPVAVSGGIATTTTSTLTVGTHQLNATFTPTDSTAFTASASANDAFTINSAAVPTTTTLGIAPPSPITQGTMSTLTATLSPTSAVGSVQFMDGATPIGSPVAVSAGKAIATTTLALNSHDVTAAFTPTDTNAFQASTSNHVTYVVNPPATATTSSLAIVPSSPQPFGTSLMFTGTVSPTSAVGTFQFLDGTTVIGTSGAVNASGVASISSSALHAGDHSITAKFVPANPANFETSTSTATPYTVTQAATSTALGVSPSSPAVQGTSVTLTATLTPGTLGGAVTFFDGATAISGAVAVSSGKAIFATTSLAIGDHSLTAQFAPAGGGDYAMSTSSAVPYTISKPPAASTSVSLGVSPSSPVIHGTTETLTATVTPSSASGTVQFYDDTTAIGSPVAVSSGVAHATTTLPDGSHPLTAKFLSGDTTTWQDSGASNTVTYVVKTPATTTTTLDVTPATTAPFGTSVTLKATLDPSSAAGSVTFTDGATTLSTVPVSAGVAQFATVALAGGSHSLKASFTPASPVDFAASVSGTASYSVTAVDTTTSLAVTAGPIEQGKQVTLTATVTPSTAGGSVTFKDGTTTLGTAAVSGGKATFKTTTLPIGTASLTAAFAPATAADYNASTSAPSTLDVVAPPVIGGVSSGGKSLTSGATLTPGQSVTVTASGFQPDDSVEVDVHSATAKLATVHADASGKVTATVTLPASLAAGPHTLTLTGSVGSVSFAFTVSAPTVAPPTPGSGDLANTGSNVLGGTVLGGALASAGVLVLLASRRRHRGLHRAG